MCGIPIAIFLVLLKYVNLQKHGITCESVGDGDLNAGSIIAAMKQFTNVPLDPGTCIHSKYCGARNKG